jgi:hypothetical protein
MRAIDVLFTVVVVLIVLMIGFVAFRLANGLA